MRRKRSAAQRSGKSETRSLLRYGERETDLDFPPPTAAGLLSDSSTSLPLQSCRLGALIKAAGWGEQIRGLGVLNDYHFFLFNSLPLSVSSLSLFQALSPFPLYLYFSLPFSLSLYVMVEVLGPSSRGRRL